MEQLSKRLMNWASILEENTREQAQRTAAMPFIFPHVALMPDAHLGRGATVGSVIPTLGAIIPAAVGVDIGCGMIAVRTQLTADEVQGRGDLPALRTGRPALHSARKPGSCEPAAAAVSFSSGYRAPGAGPQLRRGVSWPYVRPVSAYWRFAPVQVLVPDYVAFWGRNARYIPTKSGISSGETGPGRGPGRKRGVRLAPLVR
jgi:hypothetical protein